MAPPPVRPSVQRKRTAAYVTDRLSRERAEKGRGFVAELARETGIRAPHISTVLRGKGSGEDLHDALVRHWGLKDRAELERVAEAWWQSQDKVDAQLRQIREAWYAQYGDDDPEFEDVMARLIEVGARRRAAAGRGTG